MGIFSDATKWLGEKYSQVTDKFNEGVEKVVDGAQAVGNYAVDGVQAIANGAIDIAQDAGNNVRGFIQSSRGFVTNVVTGTIDGASQGVEASIGPNVITDAVKKITSGMRNVTEFQNEAENKVFEGVNDMVDKTQEKVNNGMDNIQNTANKIGDQAQNAVFDNQGIVNAAIAGTIKGSGHFVDGAVDVASHTAQRATEIAISGVENKIEDIKDGAKKTGEFIDNTMDRIQEDTEVMKKAFSQTIIGEGIENVFDYLKETKDKTFENIEDLFKNDKGEETIESIQEGIKSITEAVAEKGQSVELKFKEGLSLVFDAAKGGVNIYSSDNLTEAIGSADSKGNLLGDALEAITDKFKEGKGIINDKLQIIGDGAKEVTGDITNTLEALLNNNSQQR